MYIFTKALPADKRTNQRTEKSSHRDARLYFKRLDRRHISRLMPCRYELWTLNRHRGRVILVGKARREARSPGSVVTGLDVLEREREFRTGIYTRRHLNYLFLRRLLICFMALFIQWSMARREGERSLRKGAGREVEAEALTVI